MASCATFAPCSKFMQQVQTGCCQLLRLRLGRLGLAHKGVGGRRLALARRVLVAHRAQGSQAGLGNRAGCLGRPADARCEQVAAGSGSSASPTSRTGACRFGMRGRACLAPRPPPGWHRRCMAQALLRPRHARAPLHAQRPARRRHTSVPEAACTHDVLVTAVGAGRAARLGELRRHTRLSHPPRPPAAAAARPAGARPGTVPWTRTGALSLAAAKAALGRPLPSSVAPPVVAREAQRALQAPRQRQAGRQVQRAPQPLGLERGLVQAQQGAVGCRLLFRQARLAVPPLTQGALRRRPQHGHGSRRACEAKGLLVQPMRVRAAGPRR